MYQLTFTEIAEAVKCIINTDVQQTSKEEIIFSSKDAADTISELFIQTGNYGVVIGPYLQPVNKLPKKIWIVETCPVS